MEQTPMKNRIDTRHIDTLDGLRALAVGIVAWYHIWQQSWLPPFIRGPVAALFGREIISLDAIPRTGYLFVDFMLLLSAFLLFLPHARAMVEGGPVPDAKTFYKKRLMRILPSYYASVLLIFFLVSLPSGAFPSGWAAMKELFLNLTFTQIFVEQPFLFSRINCVLWTVCVEMQLYLIFPLLARAFRKQPALTYCAMVGISVLFNRGLVLSHPDSVRMLLNQFPAFFGVFGNGMLAALAYVKLANRTERSLALSVTGTLLTFLSGFVVARFLLMAAGSQTLQITQLHIRFGFSLALTALLLSATLSAGWLRWLLGNRLMKFFAGISYNLYIWHQWLAVQLKAWRIPYWEGAQAPNFTGDLVWQRQYTLICWMAALAAAILFTYLVEKPGARLMEKLFRKMDGGLEHETL